MKLKFQGLLCPCRSIFSCSSDISSVLGRPRLSKSNKTLQVLWGPLQSPGFCDSLRLFSTPAFFRWSKSPGTHQVPQRLPDLTKSSRTHKSLHDSQYLLQITLFFKSSSNFNIILQIYHMAQDSSCPPRFQVLNHPPRFPWYPSITLQVLRNMNFTDSIILQVSIQSPSDSPRASKVFKD